MAASLTVVLEDAIALVDSAEVKQAFGAMSGRALDAWLERLPSIIEEGRRPGEIGSDVDSSEWATWIVSTLEGSLMMSRLQRKEEPRIRACRHLEEYLETEVRAKARYGRLMRRRTA